MYFQRFNLSRFEKKDLFVEPVFIATTQLIFFFFLTDYFGDTQRLMYFVCLYICHHLSQGTHYKAEN